MKAMEQRIGSMRYRVGRMIEGATIWLAWRVPRRLAYWCAVRVNSRATVKDFPNRTPDEVSIMDALRVWW